MVATVIGAVLVAGVVLVLTLGNASPARSAAALARPLATTHPATHPATHPPTSPPPAPLQVMSVSPGNGTAAVNGVDPVQVVFSAALAPSSPLPTFSPSVSGSWRAAAPAAWCSPPRPPSRPRPRRR